MLLMHVSFIPNLGLALGEIPMHDFLKSLSHDMHNVQVSTRII